MKIVSKEFYETLDCEFINKLEGHFGEIKTEFFDFVSTQDYLDWPQKELYNSGWNVFGLRGFKKDIQLAHLKCPVSASLIKEFDELIISAGFSIMKPGTIIYPHTGYTNDVLRCHLGIKIPFGDCALKVGQTTQQWEEGKAFVFDDTILHQAWNRTDETRIIMLLDIDKKLFLNK
jgi:ornithine lipid ester-linked acyl 2-hydroxylase